MALQTRTLERKRLGQHPSPASVIPPSLWAFRVSGEPAALHSCSLCAGASAGMLSWGIRAPEGFAGCCERPERAEGGKSCSVSKGKALELRPCPCSSRRGDRAAPAPGAAAPAPRPGLRKEL